MTSRRIGILRAEALASLGRAVHHRQATSSCIQVSPRVSRGVIRAPFADHLRVWSVPMISRSVHRRVRG
jgi:hypothetical protein